jgi:hypothetical protein
MKFPSFYNTPSIEQWYGCVKALCANSQQLKRDSLTILFLKKRQHAGRENTWKEGRGGLPGFAHHTVHSVAITLYYHTNEINFARLHRCQIWVKLLLLSCFFGACLFLFSCFRTRKSRTE